MGGDAGGQCSQHLPHPVPWPLVVDGWLSWGLSQGGPPLQVVLLLPGILHTLHPLYPDLMEKLSLGLAGIIYHSGYDNDPGEVVFGELQVGSEGASASHEMAKDTLHQGTDPAQASVKVDLAGVQLDSIGPHEPSG